MLLHYILLNVCILTVWVPFAWCHAKLVIPDRISFSPVGSAGDTNAVGDNYLGTTGVKALTPFVHFLNTATGLFNQLS